MNYRHIYHAGNFADVLKHLALCLVLDHFRKKEAPFCAIDAHGGIGLYDLTSEQAQKTGEWKDGIGRFDFSDMPHDFALYADMVRGYIERQHYPGSPLLIAKALRSQDRLIANELHPDDFVTLTESLSSVRQAKVTHLDAYECIRANIPPKEKRGLVLIDPPFEKKDEFQLLIRQMGEWKKRFANGVYIIWYPIKAHLAVDDLKEAAAELGLPRTWSIEALTHPRYRTESFNGSGLIIFNAPYLVPEKLQGLAPFMAARMGLAETPSEWLTPA